MAAPSLAVFKARLDGALRNLVSWKVSLLVAGGLGLDVLQVPSNPNHSMIEQFVFKTCLLGPEVKFSEAYRSRRQRAEGRRQQKLNA